MAETQGVKESTVGTMPEVDGRKSISPETEGKIPAEVSKVSPEPSKSYSEAELLAAVHAATSQLGRGMKELETENAALKRQVTLKEQELVENKTDVENLQSKLDAMSSDDPARYDVVKELKGAREERARLRADRSALEEEKLTHADTVKVAQDTLREISIWEIAAEYQGGDPVKLKNLCDIFKASSQDQIRSAADGLWTKKYQTPQPQAPPVVPYSGYTNGGKSQTDSEIIRNYAENPRDKQAKQAWLELQQRRRNRP